MVVAATVGATNATGTAGAATPPSGCDLANGVRHVIEITFDDVHYNRDNPNVLSDLEQMPALQNFITGHGTLLAQPRFREPTAWDQWPVGRIVGVATGSGT